MSRSTRRTTNRDSQMHNTLSYTHRNLLRAVRSATAHQQDQSIQNLTKAIRALRKDKGRWGVA